MRWVPKWGVKILKTTDKSQISPRARQEFENRILGPSEILEEHWAEPQDPAVENDMSLTDDMWPIGSL